MRTEKALRFPYRPIPLVELAGPEKADGTLDLVWEGQVVNVFAADFHDRAAPAE